MGPPERDGRSLGGANLTGAALSGTVEDDGNCELAVAAPASRGLESRQVVVAWLLTLPAAAAFGAVAAWVADWSWCWCR